MDFIGGLPSKSKAKSKTEVLTRAKEARAARADTGASGASSRSAAAATRMARRFLVRARVRAELLKEWHVPTEPIGAGALVSLVNRFLRIFAGARAPTARFGALCELSRAILASMDRADHGETYVHALLSEHLASLWRAQVGGLLRAIVRTLEEARALIGTANRDPNAPAVLQTWGTLVRLALVLSDSHKWRLARERADADWTSQQAAHVDACLRALSASGALSRGAAEVCFAFEGAQLSAPTILSCLLLASKPLRPERHADELEAARCAHFVRDVLGVPNLPARLAAAHPALGARVIDAALLSLLCAGEAVESIVGGANLEGGRALAILANAVAIGARCGSGAGAQKPSPHVTALLEAGGRSSIARCALVCLERLRAFGTGKKRSDAAPAAVACAQSSLHFNPVLGWVAGLELAEWAPHASAMEAQLLAVSSHSLLELLFGTQLARPLRGGQGEAAKASRPLLGAESALSELSQAEPSLRLYLAAISTLPARRSELLSTLAFSSLLLSTLWRRLALALPAVLSQSQSALGAVAGLLAGGSRLPSLSAGQTSAILQWLELFCRAMGLLLPTLDETELEAAAIDDDGGCRRFTRADLREMAALLNPLAWACAALASAGAEALGPGAEAVGGKAAAPARGSLTDPLVGLVAILRERHARHPLCPESEWHLPHAARVAVEAEKGSALALALLCHMPWAVEFTTRVGIFRALVVADKLVVRGGDGTPGRPRTAPELLVTVRRNRLLHDGYRQLAHQPPAAMRHVLRVKFVSELGLGEVGIDHNGVFKEFMEEIVRGALDANLGLFVTTSKSKLFYPNPNSGALHDDHENLFEFVGRILGKALYEGVTLDVPLAPFFVRRALGGSSSLDELPELDEQLHSSLLFVRAHDGDVSDLCLSFAIDVDRLGVLEHIELRPGGAAIPVTDANKIQYVHLVSDFHLNRKIAVQARAFHRGMMGVLQPSWLRLFSALEVGTLLAGDDVDIDIDDLRKNCVYHGGYHELSPTVRALWQVLKEFSNTERKAFLKFVTSCSQPPLLGFQHLEPRFAVQCVAPGGADNGPLGGLLALVGLTPAERQRLPTAATCFNLLKLPDFRSKKLLREKLLVAIHSNSGFELS